jgi:hypothetical protein
MDLNTITDVIRPDRRESLPAWREGDALLAGSFPSRSRMSPG